MPSQVSTSIDGTNILNANLTVNKAGASIKSPIATFSAPNVSIVRLSGDPSVFDGSSNDTINNTLVEGTGPAGLTISYIAGTGVSAATSVRRQVELAIAGNPSTLDPFHNTTFQREPVYTASGYYHDIHGVIRNSNGTVLSVPMVSATGSQLVNGSLPDKATTANPSHYARLGLTNTETTLAARTQV